MHRPGTHRRALFGAPGGGMLLQRIVGVGSYLGGQGGILARADHRRPSGRLAGPQVPRLALLLEVAFDRRQRDPEEACHLGAWHPRVHRLDHPLA